MIQVSMTKKAGVTLATAGKYCAENVQVTPSEEILRKDEQEKAVTPSESAQDVVPDDGKVLSKVSVGAITPDIVGGLDARTFAAGAVSAIEGKGVTVPEETKVGGMAALISDIPSGGGATEPYIEETYDSSGNLIEAKLYGYTKIRDYALNECITLTSVSLPSGVTSIGDYAFSKCPNLALTSLPTGVTSIGKRAFNGCTKLALTSLPVGITSIGEYTFFSCSNLALTSLPAGITSIGIAAFSSCTKLALTSLPAGITSVGGGAFNSCPNLALTSLPNGITSIGSDAFSKCSNLTSITFEGTPTTIASTAFISCTNLTTINVPWAEGAVANAPWGATNATINYNYTEG